MKKRIAEYIRVISLQRRAGALSRLTFFLLAFPVLAQGPAWWTNRSVLAVGQQTNDYALVNLGQLKWISTKAYDEMVESFSVSTNLASLIGTNLPALIASFTTHTNTDTNAHYYLANLGQLKSVAQPFYDRLHALSLTNTLPANMPGTYPWGGGSITNDYALANIGQVKYVFSFNSAVDSDGDGIPDWQETGWGSNPYDTDSDDDGLSDGDEVNIYGTDPTKSDTDGDGLSDKWEIDHGLNPNDATDGNQLLPLMLEQSRSRAKELWKKIHPEPLVFTNTPGSQADLTDLKNALLGLSGAFNSSGGGQ